VSTTTTRLALVKPAGTENIDVSILNANADKIDAAINTTLCTSGTRPGTPFNGQKILETDTLKEYVRVGSNWRQIALNGAAVDLSLSAVTTGAVTASSATVSGAVTATAGQLNAFGAYQSYTPTYSNFTLGNGTVVGQYYRVGNMVAGSFEITVGTTSAVSGTIGVSLPSNFDTAQPSCFGCGLALDTSGGTAAYRGLTLHKNGTNNVVFVVDTGNLVNATVPFTWASTDVLRGTFTYKSL